MSLFPLDDLESVLNYADSDLRESVYLPLETSSTMSENADQEQLLSSHDNGSEDQMSFHDDMSLDSDTFEVFGSIVSFLPGALVALLQNRMDSDDGETSMMEGSTIVSSAPSGAFIPSPEPSQTIWAMSPYPRLIPVDLNTLSTTTCTNSISYQNMVDDESSSSSPHSEDDERSFNNEGHEMLQATFTRQRHSSYSGHDRVAFVAVANQLLGDITSGRQWYAQFSEQDWERLREVAKVVLTALGHTSTPALLPLPPVPPKIPRALDSSALIDVPATGCASDFLPSSFICSFCQDVIVGALALDCGCSASAVCCSCWEARSSSCHNIVEELGFVWVDSCKCPSCRRQVNSTNYCHALDVAIFEVVQSLLSQDRQTNLLKHRYYSRLDAWREAINEKNSNINKQDHHQQELLARLIQEEENMFWKKQRQDVSLKRSSAILFLGHTALALIAATAASFGLKIVSRR